MIRLGVNIDHVATLRQARYRDLPESPLAEPDPVEAARVAEKAGAHGITVHLRADRRHILDRDLHRLRPVISTKMNLEMGNTAEILEIALQLGPDDVCLVPEEREEVTTEGGLDCAAHHLALRPTIEKLRERNIFVSLFIDPEPEQIRVSAELGAQAVELHTGAYANAVGDAQNRELDRLVRAAALSHEAGLNVHAGHGLNYQNVHPVLDLPHLQELNIGHSIVSRAIFVGLENAVREMAQLLQAKA